jgi:hypothetical protein
MLVGNFYTSALPFAKCSVLILYRRLFGHTQAFRVAIYVVIAFVTAYATSGVLVIIFSCTPVAASWDLDIAALPGTHCVNRPKNYIAQASLNIVSDIVIVFLPTYHLWKLQVSFRQRVALIAIFCSGLL